MWSPVVASSDDVPQPSSRCKHAATHHDQHLYLLGGRNANVALRDFWRFDIAKNSWELLSPDGDSPGCLQEHTMVSYKDTIYVFGGEMGFSNAAETPLWMYHIQGNLWRKFVSPKGVVTPKGRRSHTALVFQDSMYIYGGYRDLKGSTSELWAFHFGSETWHLVSQGGAVDGPPPRHRHTSVLHDSCMWVFGGMTDLQEKGDFWKFDFVSRCWRPVKSKPGPGCLHSHSAVKFLNVMILFGGERDGQTLNELWRFHFATDFWEKLTLSSTQPQPRAQTVAFVFTQFRSHGGIRPMGRPQQDYFGAPPTPASARRIQPPFRAVASRIMEEAEAVLDSRVEGTRYSFLPPDSCQDEEPSYEQIPREMFRDLRRSSQFQRLDVGNPGRKDSNATLLKDIAKLSQVNLSRISHYCSYSMFSNESTESLNSGAASPASVKMNKSQSIHRIHKAANNAPQEMEMNTIMTRDNLSVPNFAGLAEEEQLSEPSCFIESKPDTCVLSKAANSLATHPAEEDLLDEGFPTLPMAKLILVDEMNPYKECSTPESPLIDTSPWSKAPFGAPRSDSQFTFQSYDCSSRSSTLSSQGRSPLPRSASKLTDSIRLIDLEEGHETSDEFSSISGYDSLEVINVPDSMLSFSNPNYLGPDIKTLLEEQQEEAHVKFAAALKTPAGNNNVVTSVEMEDTVDTTRTRPRSAFIPPSIPPANGPEMRNIVVKKTRPMSAGIMEVTRENRVSPVPGKAEPRDLTELMLLMYVIGGREVGQVTVFRRPISVWKLDLTRL